MNVPDYLNRICDSVNHSHLPRNDQEMNQNLMASTLDARLLYATG
jgi:hypothetical protein